MAGILVDLISDTGSLFIASQPFECLKTPALYACCAFPAKDGMALREECHLGQKHRHLPESNTFHLFPSVEAGSILRGAGRGA